jgi:hypothetical protein
VVLGALPLFCSSECSLSVITKALLIPNVQWREPLPLHHLTLPHLALPPRQKVS